MGLNLGIKAASGEVICRVDAHSAITRDYLRLCVERLCEGGVQNVGGAMQTLPSRPSLVARAIALCMSHRFGTGNSVFRTGSDTPVFVDTVFGGCYRKETFGRIGFFNEQLARSQDIEFNQRLRKSGGRILLDPEIKCDYFAPSWLHAFAKRNFQDGVWSILPLAYSDVMPVRWRHFVPLIFALTILLFMLLGAWSQKFWWVLAGEIGLYCGLNTTVSLWITCAQREVLYAVMMPIVFGIRHFVYGFGSLCGAIMLPFRLIVTRSTVSEKPSKTDTSTTGAVTVR